MTEFITFMLFVMIDGLGEIEDKYNLINVISNIKKVYEVFKLEYTDLTEVLITFLYTKDNFNKDKFYKKIRSKFIKAGYSDEGLRVEIDKNLEIMVKYNVIDSDNKLNENLKYKS